MATRAQLDPVNRFSGTGVAGVRSSTVVAAGPRFLGWSVGLNLSAVPMTAVIGAILIVAVVLRFWSLTAWPVFSDEDSYVATAVTVADMSVVDQIMVATPRTFKAPMLVL